jgi:hypothetical protein
MQLVRQTAYPIRSRRIVYDYQGCTLTTPPDFIWPRKFASIWLGEIKSGAVVGVYGLAERVYSVCDFYGLARE